MQPRVEVEREDGGRHDARQCTGADEAVAGWLPHGGASCAERSPRGCQLADTSAVIAALTRGSFTRRASAHRWRVPGGTHTEGDGRGVARPGGRRIAGP